LSKIAKSHLNHGSKGKKLSTRAVGLAVLATVKFKHLLTRNNETIGDSDDDSEEEEGLPSVYYDP
jgi:hypothetical protein